MRGSAVPTEELDLQRDREVISPPTLTTPHIACQQRVHANSFLPGAEVEVRVRASDLTEITRESAMGGWPMPDGLLVDVGFELKAGQFVDARQHHDGRTSEWSPTTEVLSIEAAFPLGLPRPELRPTPPLDCGVRVGVGNLPVDFEVTVRNSNHGDVGAGRVYRDDTCGYNVAPANQTGDIITAIARFCGEETEISAAVTTAAAPVPIPTPAPDAIVEGADQIGIGNIANGAMVHVSLNGSPLGSWPCFGGRIIVDMPAPLTAGDIIDATQTLCSDQPGSDPGSTTVSDCSTLTPPMPASAQAGDLAIVILNPQPSVVVEVYADLQKIGESAGPVISLIRPLQAGETVVLIARVDNCESPFAWTLDAACVDPPFIRNPADLNVLPVGWTDVGGDDVLADLGLPDPAYSGVRVHGVFYYPAATDGQDTPVHPGVADGTAPLVVVIHGRHNAGVPSYRGYLRLQEMLARQGIASVSVDHNDLQGPNGLDNILARARLTTYLLAFLAGDLAALGPQFAPPAVAAVIDFERIGVIGHSRGGDTAVLLQHVTPAPGFDVALPGTVRAVLPLAPTTFGTVDDPFDFRPVGVDVLAVLPAMDGDVRENPGQKHYDLARPTDVRAQLLVADTNHNRYNTVWWEDHLAWLADPATGQREDTWQHPGLPLLSMSEHQRILISYGAALFQRALLGLAQPLPILAGRARPSGARTDKVRMCHSLDAATVVDSFEDSDLGTNDQGLGNVADAGFDATWLPAVDDPGLSPVVPRSQYFGETGRMRTFTFSPDSQFFHFEVNRALRPTAEILIRAAEDHVAGDRVEPEPLDFALALDPDGPWVWSSDVGGVIPVVQSPYNTRSVFVTLRFRLACFSDGEEEVQVDRIVLRTNWDGDGRRYVFDDLEIVEALS